MLLTSDSVVPRPEHRDPFFTCFVHFDKENQCFSSGVEVVMLEAHLRHKGFGNFTYMTKLKLDKEFGGAGLRE